MITIRVILPQFTMIGRNRHILGTLYKYNLHCHTTEGKRQTPSLGNDPPTLQYSSSSIYDLIFLASRVRKIATSCRRYKADREEWRDSYHWSPIYLGPFFPALPPLRRRVSVGCRACTLERQRKERKMGSADDMGISQRHLPLALSLGL